MRLSMLRHWGRFYTDQPKKKQMQPKIHSKETFSKEIENFVIRTNCSYIDAIMTVCEQSDIEPETAAKLLTNSVRTMVEKEAGELNLITIETSKLDFK